MTTIARCIRLATITCTTNWSQRSNSPCPGHQPQNPSPTHFSRLACHCSSPLNLCAVAPPTQPASAGGAASYRKPHHPLWEGPPRREIFHPRSRAKHHQNLASKARSYETRQPRNRKAETIS